MRQLVTKGIILARVDYGEADRIITLLTPDHGKLRLMARGVRKVKSKLAGGIELFSVSDITFIQGRGEVGTLISSRLLTHYGRIVQNIDRVQLGYDLIKSLNKATEDEPGPEYFDLLQQAFAALDDLDIGRDLIRIWFAAQLLRLGGHTPNLRTDTGGASLQPDKTYEFDSDSSSFINRPDGHFAADDIKFLRLLFSGNQPTALAKITSIETLVQRASPLVTFMSRQYIH